MRRVVAVAVAVWAVAGSAGSQTTFPQWSAQRQNWQPGAPWCPGGETWAELMIPAGGGRPETVISYGPGVGVEESVSADLSDGPERYHAALTDRRLARLYGRLMGLHRACAAGGTIASQQCISLGQAKRVFVQAFDAIVDDDGGPVMVNVAYNAVADRFTTPKLPQPELGGPDRRPLEAFLGLGYHEFYRWNVPFQVGAKRYGPSDDHCRQYECDYLGWAGPTVQAVVQELSYGIQPEEYQQLQDGMFVPVCEVVD